MSGSSAGRSIFTRNRPSKKSLPRSASQGPILQGQSNASTLVVNNPLATQLNATSARQPTPTAENNDISYINQQASRENTAVLSESANQSKTKNI